MKLLVSLNNKKLDDYLNYTNSFIIGLKEFSVNYLEFSIEEIKGILEKYPQVELFVSVNKNLFNDELKCLEERLKELAKLKIKGVLFYDLAVLALVQNNKLNIPLVWHQGHMVTNYNTCNYYYDKGCKYAYLSSEITVSEMKEIKENSKIALLAFLFGHPVVSFSKRKLLSNYFLYHDLSQDNDHYLIKSHNSDDYIIKENLYGTSIIHGKILNGIKPFFELRDTLSYAVLDEQFIEHALFLKVLAIFAKALKGESDLSCASSNLLELIKSDETMFFYKKTIYKVKDERKN